MKVGILSMQQIKNYGSFLQAFSLKRIIEGLGHTCEFINIIPGEQLENNKVGKFYKVKLLVHRLLGWDFVSRCFYIFKYQKRFSKEFIPYLGVYEGVNGSHFDTVVIGSDEVFNCTQKTWFGFSRQLFGEGINADNLITYAASFGSTDKDALDRFGISEIVANLLKKINKLSVRDINSFVTIEKLTGLKADMHLDPVFIFNYNDFMPQSKIDENYLLVYTYPGRINEKHEISAIKSFAEKQGLKIISIGHYFSWVDRTVIPTPFEVLAYFRDADYVVTDTFHGSVMSIKYNKSFCAIVRSMNSNKLTYLLSQFGLTDRIVHNMSDVQIIMDKPINYDKVNGIISDETQRSIEYLRNNLYVKHFNL